MPNTERSRAQGVAKLIGLYVISVVVALVVSAVLIKLTGGPWQKVVSAFFDGAFRRKGRWGLTLTEAAPAATWGTNWTALAPVPTTATRLPSRSTS